jgi:hypothetical protein
MTFHLASSQPMLQPTLREANAHAETQSDREQTTESQKRYRRKSVRRQLQDVITQLGKVANDPHQKPAKKVDALLRQSEVLLRLQAMDAEERDQTLQDEHAALTARHAANTQRLQELEAQSAELKRQASRVERIVVPDPEHAKTRQQCVTLGAALDAGRRAEVSRRRLFAQGTDRDSGDPTVARRFSVLGL